jgi:hypothetical protein
LSLTPSPVSAAFRRRANGVPLRVRWPEAQSREPTASATERSSAPLSNSAPTAAMST